MKPPRLPGVWVLFAGLATAACSGTIRFDDHSIARQDAGHDAGDAAVDTRGDDASSERPGWCDATTCDFLGQPCGSSSCLLHCPHGKTCSGRCESGCTADCEENAVCTLTTGEGADLECEPEARCSFIVGRASRIECRAQSDCGTRCLGNCTVSCAADATCALACGDAAPMARVSGVADCP